VPDAEAASAERVRRFIAGHVPSAELICFEQSTKTAQLAAEAIGCELGQIAKSLVFVADGTPVLALVAGDRRGDADAIARETGAASVRFASPEAVLEATAYTTGGVPPFDLPHGLPVLVDDSLGRFEVVYPAGGTASAIVRMTFAELVSVTSGRVCAVSR
jgi:prolyl-tRNA editing enzyme YbaK/EbsC (Cys-tRNA(Pro) deacylase)